MTSKGRLPGLLGDVRIYAWAEPNAASKATTMDLTIRRDENTTRIGAAFAILGCTITVNASACRSATAVRTNTAK